MYKKETVLLPGPAGMLETAIDPGERVTPAPRPTVAIIAHPHPLYGGTMDNKVVTTLSRMYRQLGIDAVRFNFRGVGASEGMHDQGRGEVADVLAVVDHVLEQRPGVELVLAGFSFGSAMVAAASDTLSVTPSPCQHMVLVAPPVDRYSYAPRGQFACASCIVIGEADDIVDAAVVGAWVQALEKPPRLISIPEASHFFHGALSTMKARLEPEVRAMISEAGIAQATK